MHEYSIVQALLQQCEEYAASNGAQKITRVTVKIGRLSGVEPHLLESAFETFREKTVCDGAEFVMELQNVVIVCNGCGEETELEELFFKCPECGSTDVRVIDGEELMLMQLEME